MMTTAPAPITLTLLQKLLGDATLRSAWCR
jgi:hypothetical protein